MRAAIRKTTATILAVAFLAQPAGPAFAVEQTTVQEGEAASIGTGQTPTETAPQQDGAEEQGEHAATENDTPDSETGKLKKESEEDTESIEGPLSPELLSSEEDDPALFLNAKLDKEKPTLRPDEMSGALRYTFNLTIPPGRNGMQPQLNLEYSSQDRAINSIFGQGWKVDIPYIQRLNKTGLENLYASTTNFFYSSVSGELATTSTPGQFFARSDDGSFIRYEFAGNQWTATDKVSPIAVSEGALLAF
jgi:hypothetical protein